MPKKFSQDKRDNKIKKSENVKKPLLPDSESTSTPVIKKAEDTIPSTKKVRNTANKKKTNFIQRFTNAIQSMPKWVRIVAGTVASLIGLWGVIDSIYYNKASLEIQKQSLLPKIGIYTGNRSFNNNVDVTKPEIIIKNFGNIAVKNVKISARADLRYVDIPDDSISSYTVVNKILGDFDVGHEKRVKINLPNIFQDAIKGEDTRFLFLHFKIVFTVFDEIIENPRAGVKFIRAGENTRYEDCEHN